MPIQRYASKTSVPVARTRGEIDRLLREWGCRQISWGEDFEAGRVMLQFVWHHLDQDYLARFELQLPDDAALRAQSINLNTRRVSEPKLAKVRTDRGKSEHRQLLLWLKASLNACEAGIVDAATLFLPWLVGQDGRTVAEVAIPRLESLLSGDASKLLLGDGNRTH